MKRLGDIMERLALSVLLVGGAGMLTAMFLGAGDVVGTQFFGWPIHGALEITESTMVLIVFGGLAYAQIRRSHIRVELLYSHMPPRVRAAMDVFSDIAAMIFFGLLLWQAVNEAMFSWSIGEAADGLIQFPLYPARFILAAGTALLILQLVLDLVLDIQRLRGKAPIEDPASDLGAAPDGLPDIPELREPGLQSGSRQSDP
ncbi:MAG: TRAP transporter small permease [Rhodospirillaceae bacterium]|jgi:TRAP-type C4-dicarboxylate transport system permease small subunit|nr:TRAP transporter small permease [Rhodospirillaceae bacterium]